MRAWRNLLLVGASLLFAGFASELLLRLLDVSFPQFYTADPYTGAALLPGAAGWYRQEGEAYIRINSNGLRDREHDLKKPPNSFRIAVLGDSMAEALQVDINKTFWSVLQARLSDKCGILRRRNVEAINFGVSGYGTAQELLTLRHKVWFYDPDFVVLAFLTGNDVRNNYRELEGDVRRPYFLLDDGDNLVLDDSFLQSNKYRMRAGALGEIRDVLLSHSRLAQVIFHVKNLLVYGHLWNRTGQDGAMLFEPGIDDEIYKEPDSLIWQQAWAVTERLIVQMHDEVTSRGADFLLATLSNSVQVHPKSEIRAQFMQEIGVDNLFYPDRRLASLAKRFGIDHLQLAPPLREWAEREQVCIHGFGNSMACSGHWNENGHRLAGQLMAEAICAANP